MTQHATSFVETRASFAETSRHPATTGARVVLFWLIAAAAVGATHARLDSLSSSGSAVASIAAIVMAAYCYTRFCAPQAGIRHALGVGIVWLLLGIVAEFAMAIRLGHGWYAILGSPERPLLRNIFLFVWILAPALFARQAEEDFDL